VSAGYFTTLGARLARGRYFREDDDASKPPIVIVNRTLANRYFPGESPIGKQIYYDWDPKTPREIVGVVEDIKEGPLEGAPGAALYVPYNQIPCDWPAVLVRTSQSAASLLPGMTRTIHGIDPFLSYFRAGDHERTNRSVTVGISSSIRGVAGRSLRGKRALIEPGRIVWRGCLFGEPENT
jgi:hypothetical protein